MLYISLRLLQRLSLAAFLPVPETSSFTKIKNKQASNRVEINFKTLKGNFIFYLKDIFFCITNI